MMVSTLLRVVFITRSAGKHGVPDLTSFAILAGQHNDSRMNMALVMTAVNQGAIAANHTEVVALHKNSEGKLNGARLKDVITGDEWNVKAKVSR